MSDKPNSAHGNGEAEPEEIWEPMVPPPADAPQPPERELKNCDKLYLYLDADGRLLFYVRRREARDGESKQFLPLTYGLLKRRKDPKPVLGWHTKSPSAPRPLYGLEKLAARANDPVMVCEGEKAAEAAQRLFPKMVRVLAGRVQGSR